MTSSGAARGGGGGKLPLWVDVQKLCNMCVHAVNVSAFKGLRTLDPL